MQIGARYKAVFELMQEVFKDRQPADNLINNYFRDRRYIGSGDRRFIAETIWEIIRHRSRLEFEAGELNPRKMLLIWLKNENSHEVFDGGQYSLPPLSLEEKDWLEKLPEEVYPAYVEAECPKWLFDKINNPELLKAMNQTATADFRINGLSREEIINQLGREGFEFYKTPYSPIGLRSDNRINLNNCMAYQEGLIEVQDEASQLVSILCDVKPEHKIIDYCCGAGGKSLTLSYLLKGKGIVEAHDIDHTRLEHLKPRMQRLKAENIKPVKEAGINYQRFIIDAPCSGSGTWRRSPDAKYRLNEKKLADIIKIQSEILETAYQKTAKGGRIIYITCSILPEENQAVIKAFKELHPELKSIDLKTLWEEKTSTKYPDLSSDYLQFSPLATGTDGFFITILEKV